MEVSMSIISPLAIVRQEIYRNIYLFLWKIKGKSADTKTENNRLRDWQVSKKESDYMKKITLGDRINYYLRKHYDIEYKNREILINSKIKVAELGEIRMFLKNNCINYKNIVVKGDNRCSYYMAW